MSASRTIQAASIFYLDNLLATASALYTSSACCSGKILLHRHFLHSLFSVFVVFNSFLMAVGEALHSLFYISFSKFAGTSTNSTISYWVSLCLVSVALFSTHIFLDFPHFTPRWRQRGTSSTSSSLLLLTCTLLVILHWSSRGNFHVLFSRDWKSLFIKRNLL